MACAPGCRMHCDANYLGGSLRCTTPPPPLQSSDVRLSFTPTSSALGADSRPTRRIVRSTSSQFNASKATCLRRRSVDWIQRDSSVRGGGNDCVRMRRGWNVAECLRWSDWSRWTKNDAAYLIDTQRTHPLIRASSLSAVSCLQTQLHACYTVDYLLTAKKLQPRTDSCALI